MRFASLDNASRWPFSFPNFNFVCPFLSHFFPFSFSTCVLRILWCVPPKRSISFAQLFAERLLWISIFEIHNLGPFFLSQNRNCSLSTLFLRLLAGFFLTISMSIQAMIAVIASGSRLVITTHGRMSKITRRSFTSCPLMDKGFELQPQGWPLDLSSFSRPFPSVQKRMLALYLSSFASYSRLV